MKAITYIALTLIVVSLFIGGFQSAHATGPFVNAETAVLIDANTGRILYSKNAERVMFPASTTKILTALLAIENGDLDEIITVGSEVNMIAWDSSRAHLQPGDEISLRDLLYGLMLASGNDAAYTTAVHIARTVAQDPEMSNSAALNNFIAMMNDRARELGAENSNFANPDGYPHRDHYTTAKDLALITAGAMENPDYRELDSAANYSPQTWAGSNARTWNNGNFLINPRSDFHYAKAIGGKTGFTFPAGFTMVATAAQDDMELVAVALKTDANGRWQDTISMLEYGFNNYSQETITFAGEVVASVGVTGESRIHEVVVKEDYSVSLRGNEAELIESRVRLNPELLDLGAETPTLKVPVKSGEVIGEKIHSLNGQELRRVELTVKEDISIIQWLRSLFAFLK